MIALLIIHEHFPQYKIGYLTVATFLWKLPQNFCPYNLPGLNGKRNS